jgi:hypothetical protein
MMIMRGSKWKCMGCRKKQEYSICGLLDWLDEAGQQSNSTYSFVPALHVGKAGSNPTPNSSQKQC